MWRDHLRRRQQQKNPGIGKMTPKKQLEMMEEVELDQLPKHQRPRQRRKMIPTQVPVQTWLPSSPLGRVRKRLPAKGIDNSSNNRHNKYNILRCLNCSRYNKK